MEQTMLEERWLNFKFSKYAKNFFILVNEDERWRYYTWGQGQVHQQNIIKWVEKIDSKYGGVKQY